MKKQTAVEFIYQELWQAPKDKWMWQMILKQAKEMEKEQIIEFANSFYDNCGLQYGGLEKLAEEYYNETYGDK
jgi:hypothetical protein